MVEIIGIGIAVIATAICSYNFSLYHLDERRRFKRRYALHSKTNAYPVFRIEQEYEGDWFKDYPFPPLPWITYFDIYDAKFDRFGLRKVSLEKLW